MTEKDIQALADMVEWLAEDTLEARSLKVTSVGNRWYLSVIEEHAFNSANGDTIEEAVERLYPHPADIESTLE